MRRPSVGRLLKTKNSWRDPSVVYGEERVPVCVPAQCGWASWLENASVDYWESQRNEKGLEGGLCLSILTTVSFLRGKTEWLSCVHLLVLLFFPLVMLVPGFHLSLHHNSCHQSA